MIEARIRTRIHPDELELKKGKIVTSRDYNLLLTGPARMIAPNGEVMAVYLPGVLADLMDDVYPTLSRIRVLTDNRGMASGAPREKRGDQKRSRARKVMSSTLGSVDPGPSVSRTSGRLPACRMTAWTGAHLPEFAGMHPLFQAISDQFKAKVPERWEAQMAVARDTHPDWVIPNTPFTTITVNNTYSTGVHQDVGDLKDGFSTLAVCRRGDYTGGELVFPEYRVALDMRHGDLLLFNPHNWHGNAGMRCPHKETDLERPCKEGGCERISIVCYFRTKVRGCESFDLERAKAIDALVE